MWIVGCFWVLIMIAHIFPKVGHRLFGWHKVTQISGFDGASSHGTCTICGKDCMQDSNGDWF